jgi:heme-degrading monooxygenase HmoA
MTTIATDKNVVTLVNIFMVEPEQQQHLIDLLVQATEAVMKRQPGFVSANIHRGLDGTHVANYAQWRTRDDFEAMLRNPEVRPHMQEIMSFATFAAQFYEVAYTHEVSDG